MLGPASALRALGSLLWGDLKPVQIQGDSPGVERVEAVAGPFALPPASSGFMWGWGFASASPLIGLDLDDPIADPPSRPG